MIENRYCGLLLAFMVTTTPAIATAAEPNQEYFYAGFGAGSSTVSDLWDGFTKLTERQTDDTGWKIYGGYQFSPVLGVEAGYTGAGEFSATAYSPNDPTHVGLNAAVDIFSATATVAWPLLEGFSVFGKIGMTLWDVDISKSLEGNTIFYSDEGQLLDDDDGIGVTFGIGARYFATKNIGVRLEWDWYSVGDGSSSGDLDINLFSAGVVFAF